MVSFELWKLLQVPFWLNSLVFMSHLYATWTGPSILEWRQNKKLTFTYTSMNMVGDIFCQGETYKRSFCISVLKVVKEAQLAHGLRHNDYQLYRQYCSRRIRRLRKNLKLIQGDRKNFRKKEVTVNLLKEERYAFWIFDEEKVLLVSVIGVSPWLLYPSFYSLSFFNWYTSAS